MMSSNGNILRVAGLRAGNSPVTLLALCAGIHRSPVNSPHEGQWRVALKFSLICTWINDRVNIREAGDLFCLECVTEFPLVSPYRVRCIWQLYVKAISTPNMICAWYGCNLRKTCQNATIRRVNYLSKYVNEDSRMKKRFSEKQWPWIWQYSATHALT